MGNEKVNEEAKQHWRDGNALFEENKYDKAIFEYNQALLIDSEYIDAYFNKGLAERLLQDYTASKRDFESVVKLDPKSVDAIVLLGDIEEESNNYQEAKAFYEKALAINPEYSEGKSRLTKINELINSNVNQISDNNNNNSSSIDDQISNNNNNNNNTNDIIEHQSKNETVIEEGQIKKIAFYKSNSNFSNVIGLQKIKDYLRNNIILSMQHPELFKKYGKKQGLGLILYGPPGTGKTFIVNAISGESNANVIIARINQIIDMYTGNTEKNLHAIFEQARQNAPCIIFFDELDALGVKRGGSSGGGGESSALRLAVNQFLIEMNGLEENPQGIYVIGATNNPWDIDPALKRSGRFGDRIYLSPPNYGSRKLLFNFYTKHTPKKNLDVGRLSRATMGYSPADIERICDKAIMLPLLHEFELKKERKLKTNDLLNVLKDKDNGGSSLDEWYLMVKKEIINTREVQIVNGKKQETIKEGKLNSEEKILYKTMIKDIKQNTNAFMLMIKKFMRIFALYLF